MKKVFTACVALVVMAVFVTAGSSFGGDIGPFYEDRYENFLYESEKSVTGYPEEGVGRGPFFVDNYEDFLYETEKGGIERSVEADTRFFGIEPAWQVGE